MSIEDNCKEFMNYVTENEEIPKQSDNNIFSDGVKMGKWWSDYKTHKRGNKEYYKDLLTIDLLKTNYENYLKNNKN